MEVTKAPDGKMSALWARSNAALGETVFQKYPPGNFQGPPRCHRGCLFRYPPHILTERTEPLCTPGTQMTFEQEIKPISFLEKTRLDFKMPALVLAKWS